MEMACIIFPVALPGYAQNLPGYYNPVVVYTKKSNHESPHWTSDDASELPNDATIVVKTTEPARELSKSTGLVKNQPHMFSTRKML